MNRIGLIATFALSFAASAYAQQTEWVDPATPLPLAEKAEPAAIAIAPAVPQLLMDSRRGHDHADARQCLQLAANEQIHRCAEKYRTHLVAAKVVKASLPASGSKPADTAKLQATKALGASKAESVSATEAPKAISSSVKSADAAKTPAAKPVEPTKGAK